MVLILVPPAVLNASACGELSSCPPLLRSVWFRAKEDKEPSLATIDIQQPHALPIEKAAEHLRSLIDDFHKKSGDLVQDVNWAPDGHSAVASGNGFSARFALNEREATVEVDLNLMLRPFKKKIAARLERKLEEALGA